MSEPVSMEGNFFQGLILRQKKLKASNDFWEKEDYFFPEIRPRIGCYNIMFLFLSKSIGKFTYKDGLCVLKNMNMATSYWTTL